MKFFSPELVEELVKGGVQGDLVLGNNVLAQVPGLNSFIRGICTILNPEGVCTLEFPHLLKTIAGNQFDQIYHEHFSYFSIITAERVFAAHGLRIFDVEELWTHGSSLRAYLCHGDAKAHRTLPAVSAVQDRERASGLDRLETYAEFGEKVRATKRQLLTFLIEAKARGKSIVGYDASGKGNTLLNYCGISTDFLDYTVARNPCKQGKYLPGTHIPIFPPERIAETRPDFVLILPWNLKEEIAAQRAYIHDWGGKLIVPILEVSKV